MINNGSLTEVLSTQTEVDQPSYTITLEKPPDEWYTLKDTFFADYNEGKSTISMQVVQGCIPVTMGSKSVPALIDTGASISCVSKRFLSRSGLICSKTEKCLYKVSLADGSETIARQKIFVTFSVKDISFSHSFLLLKTLHRPIILGVDFLSYAKARITFTGLPPQENNPIRSIKCFTIPARTEYIATAEAVSVKDLCSTIGIIDTFLHSNTTKLAVKRILVKPDEANMVRIVLYNHSDNDIHFIPGDLLGLYTIADPSKFQKFSDKTTQVSLRSANIGPVDPSDAPLEWSVNTQPSHDGDILHSLASPQTKNFNGILEDHLSTFVSRKNKIGATDKYEHKMDLKPDYVPVNKLPYRATPEKRRIIDQMIQEQVKEGIIEECTDQGEWSSPIFLVEKPGSTPENRKYHVVQDFRELNQQIKDMASPYPRQDDVLEIVGASKAKVFSRMDAQSGFYQIPLRKEDRPLTAFTTHDKRYQYKVMPQGLKTSPRGFQNFMEIVIKDLKYRHTLCYIDDIVCYSPTIEQHMKDLDELFTTLEEAKLKLRRDKCTFFLKRMKFLGFLIDEHGLHPDPAKVRAIRDYQPPKNIKQVRSFAGMAQFYRKFVKDFSTIMRPIYALTNHNTRFHWSDACQIAFEKIKKSIVEDVTLSHPNFDDPFTITTDASQYGIGACISQDKDGFLRPIAFASRCLNQAEMNYSATDRELLAVIYGLEQFRHYVEHKKFTLYTDHNALVSLLKKKEMTRRLARYVSFLQTFDFDLRYLKGKMNQVADALSRRPLDPPMGQETQESSLNSRVPSPKVRFSMCDLVYNIREDDILDRQLPMFSRKPPSILRPSSIPFAHEQMAISQKQSSTQVDTSVSLSSNPLGSPAEEHLAAVSTRAQTKLSNPPPPLPTAIPPSQVEESLAKTTTGKLKKKKTPNIPKTNRTRVNKKKQKASNWVTINSPSILETIENLFPEPINIEDIQRQQSEDEYLSPLIKFLTYNTLPDDSDQARRVLLTQEEFILQDNTLYHISSDNIGNTLCQVVIPSGLVSAVIARHHDPPTSSHLGVHKTIWAIKQHFFWPNINRDVRNFISNCHQCMSSKPSKFHQKQPMTLRDPAPYPFASVCMDIVGPIKKSEDGNRYIHVVTDYYSRYVVAWASPTIDTEEVISGFIKNVANIYGYPETLQTDNGSSYASHQFRSFCRKSGIKHIFSTPYRPQTNGLVERFNQSIITALRSYTDTSQKLWDRYISYVTFALNNSPSNTTGFPPNFLIFGRILATPAAIGLPDPDVTIKTGLKHLSNIVETQNSVSKEMQKNLEKDQKKMKDRHDKKSKLHKLYPGAVVYVKVPSLLKKGTSKKLQPVYAGPFVVTRLPSPNTVKLRHIDSLEEITKSVHVERIKLSGSDPDTINPFQHRLINSARKAQRERQEDLLSQKSSDKRRKKILASKVAALKVSSFRQT